MSHLRMKLPVSVLASLLIGLWAMSASVSAAPTKKSTKPAPAAVAPAPSPPATTNAAGIPTAPEVDARAYVLVDYVSGEVLADRNADQRMEPASLTKLMTCYLVFHALKTGTLKMDEPVTISAHAWKAEGSRTFVQVGSQVPAEVLIKGMIVQSGNDATIALAERVGGTEPAFVQLMNDYAKRLGLNNTHFDDSSGLPSATHYTTARDLSLLASALVRDFPEYYSWFSIREFVWNNIKQQNRNGLLERDASVDEDRPHGQRRILSRDLRQTRQHAPDRGGARLRQHQSPGRRQRRADQLRLYVLSGRQRQAARHHGAQAAHLQGR